MLLFRYYLIFIVSLLPAALYAAGISVRYELEFPDQFNGCLNIHSQFTLKQSGIISLKVPQNGVKSFNVDDKHLASIVAGSAPYTYQIAIEANVPVMVDYSFCPINPEQNLDTPLVANDFIYFSPLTAFLWPYKQDDQLWDIEIHFTNKPNQLNAYSPLLIQKNKIMVNIEGAVFLNTPIFFGRDELFSFNQDNYHVFLYQRGNLNQFPNNYLNDFFKIMLAQRQFWNENHPETAYVILNANNQANYQSGMHPESTLVMNYWPNAEYWSGLHGFSHENFHNWLGRKIHFPTHCGDMIWLIEGLTDYFGLSLAHESGIMDEKTYVRNLNETIKRYYLSPIKSLTNVELKEKVYQDSYYQGFAQYRGHLTAFQMDIKAPNAMTEAVKLLYNVRPSIVSHSDIDKAFLRAMDRNKWEHMQKILNGDTALALPKTILNGKAVLEFHEIQSPDFKFELTDFIENHQVKNLKVDSTAFKAGLREGDQILSHKLRLYTLNELSEVSIIKGDKVKRITFVEKQSYPVKIPQYVLND